MFELPAWLLAWFYSLTGSYLLAIALIAVVVMLLITPLTLKSTKGMLEMQRLAPEMRRLQTQYRSDRQKLNEEMMKLYQEHGVNPLASCLPLLAQMPVFIIMFRILHGLTYKPTQEASPVVRAVYVAAGQTPPENLGFIPRYISHDSDMYRSLFGQTKMTSLGLDLARSPVDALGDGLGPGLVYALLVVRPRRVVLPPATDGRRPGRGQPDDVAGPAEADAVPAGGVRRLPGLLPRRPDHLLHGPGRAADRPAGVHHAALLRPRRVARPPGPAGERVGARARQGRPGGERDRRRRRQEGRRRSPRRDRQAREQAAAKQQAKAPARGGGDRRADGATKRTTPPKGRPTPTGKAGGGARPTDEPPGRAAGQGVRQAPALRS